MSSRGLEGVSIDRPCPKRWSELVGDERRRYCATCALHVTNLSALTRTEAEGFLAASRGRVCVTYLPDERGGVSTASEAGVARRCTRFLARSAAHLFGLVLLLSGCRPAPAPSPDAAHGSPEPDEAGTDGQRLLGQVRPDPVCQVDEDDRMILGEMAPDPAPPEPAQK